MLWIAIRLLLGDKTKFVTLVLGLTFATTLIVQQASVFCGVMLLLNVVQINTHAKIWVVDSDLKEINVSRPMPEIELQRVRSVSGVEWAMPLSFSSQMVIMPNGEYQQVYLVGVDTHTLTGIPTTVVEGSLDNLKFHQAVMLDDLAAKKLSPDPSRSLTIGDRLEINGHEVIVEAICTNAHSIQNSFIYTTFAHLKEILGDEGLLNFILVEPRPNWKISTVIQNINQLSDIRAYSNEDLFWKNTWWNIRNTVVAITFGVTIALGFIIGILISGQTFYMFIIENMRYWAVLKTLGIGDLQLFYMLILQAYWVGVISFGLGVGLASLFGYYASTTNIFPYYMPFQLFIYSLFSILGICTLAVFIGLRKVKTIDPAIIFRS